MSSEYDLVRYDRLRAEHPQEFAEAIELERQRFGDILGNVLQACGYVAPRHRVNILSLACGVSVEAPVLVEQFGGGQIPEQEVNITGIDLSARNVELAREHTTDLPGFHHFLVGDARNLNDLAYHVPSEVDVALFRRQNIGNQPPVWEKIFEEGMTRVHDDGIGIMTSINWSEHLQALTAFQRLGYEPDLRVPFTTHYWQDSLETHASHTAPPVATMPIDMCISVFHR